MAALGRTALNEGLRLLVLRFGQRVNDSLMPDKHAYICTVAEQRTHVVHELSCFFVDMLCWRQSSASRYETVTVEEVSGQVIKDCLCHFLTIQSQPSDFDAINQRFIRFCLV